MDHSLRPAPPAPHTAAVDPRFTAVHKELATAAGHLQVLCDDALDRGDGDMAMRLIEASHAVHHALASFDEPHIAIDLTDPAV
jgi:hypothetical protein